MNTLQDLNERGFAVIADVISRETVALLIDELRHLLIGGSRRAGLRNLLAVSPLSRTLANSGTLESRIKPILGDDVKCVRGLYFDKRREANWKVAWHQDLTIAVKQRSEVPGYGPWSHKAGIVHVQPPTKILERMVSLRLHLDDADERNGALIVLPGSHQCGKLNSRKIEELKRKITPEVCDVSRGGVMLMRPLLVHASSVATTPTHRRVLHFEYAVGELDNGLEWDEEI
jgi:hypothetical protein